MNSSHQEHLSKNSLVLNLMKKLFDGSSKKNVFFLNVFVHYILVLIELEGCSFIGFGVLLLRQTEVKETNCFFI